MARRDALISSILRKAKKWALDLKFASSEGNWFINIEPKLKASLLELCLEDLVEINNSDYIINSILETLEKPIESPETSTSPEPIYYSSISPSIEDLRESALIEGGFLNSEDIGADPEQIADIIRELIRKPKNK